MDAVLGIKKKNNSIISCIGCRDVLEADHTGIKCVGDHHICPECSQNYVKQVFEDPTKHIPLKCMECTAEVIAETFERQLNTKESQLYLNMLYTFNESSFLAENEIIASCPFCDYFEINIKDSGRMLFCCKNPKCKHKSCVFCNKQVHDHANQANDDQKYDIDQDDFEKHFECARLAPFKQKWDKAISDGNTRQCPKCGVSGMKDDACTHMTCVKCDTLWCYVCGVEVEKLDKAHGFADHENNINGHNVDWKTNPKRCPMYLDQINEVDKRWPADENGDVSVTFMHRLRTMGLLKNAVEEMGDKNFRAICDKYEVDKSCGFDMDDVMNGIHKLILRENELKLIYRDNKNEKLDIFFDVDQDDEDEDDEDDIF